MSMLKSKSHKAFMYRSSKYRDLKRKEFRCNERMKVVEYVGDECVTKYCKVKVTEPNVKWETESNGWRLER